MHVNHFSAKSTCRWSLWTDTFDVQIVYQGGLFNATTLSVFRWICSSVQVHRASHGQWTPANHQQPLWARTLQIWAWGGGPRAEGKMCLIDGMLYPLCKNYTVCWYFVLYFMRLWKSLGFFFFSQIKALLQSSASRKTQKKKKKKVSYRVVRFMKHKKVSRCFLQLKFFFLL